LRAVTTSKDGDRDRGFWGSEIRCSSLPQDITVADVAAVATAAFAALLLIGHSCNTANSSWTSACADAALPIAHKRQAGSH